ncbi:hypothetical protein S96127_3953 [Yersinia pestis]|nr:hypothetical protein S96127_3953 [Yersinia pestis]
MQYSLEAGPAFAGLVNVYTRETSSCLYVSGLRSVTAGLPLELFRLYLRSYWLFSQLRYFTLKFRELLIVV